MLGYDVERRQRAVRSWSGSGTVGRAGAGTQDPSASRAPSPYRVGSGRGPSERPGGEGPGDQSADGAPVAQAHPGRGSFRSVPALITAIRASLREQTHHPRPFIWTATTSKIMRKIRYCKEALDTI